MLVGSISPHPGTGKSNRWSDFTMKNLYACALLFFSISTVAAESDSKEEIKEAARKACVAAAVEKYGEGTAPHRAHRKKIGKKRGYAFAMRVGGGKKINCIADAKGETTFFRGQL